MLKAAAVGLAASLLAGCGAPGDADVAAGSPTQVSTPGAELEPTPASEPSAGSTPEARADPDPEAGTHGGALALLGALAVKGRAPMTGYDRDEFGQAWADVDRNGCDTRNDVLRRDLARTVLKPGTGDCVVLSGDSPSDPYTAAVIRFERGDGQIQIDHVVALADAWQKGAGTWESRKRIAFGNDPLNLLAVASAANQQKGAGDAATWLPANVGYRCAYVARQVAVKAKYEVWVTEAEREAMARVLAGCPDEQAPHGDAPVLAPEGLGVVVRGESAQPDGSAPEVPASVSQPGAGATDRRFAYCKDVKAAGYGPYVQGTDPEYDWYRDADSDGTVCE